MMKILPLNAFATVQGVLRWLATSPRFNFLAGDALDVEADVVAWDSLL